MHARTHTHTHTPKGRDPQKIEYIAAYLKAVGMFRDYTDPSQDPVFSEIVELDLATVVPSLSGPKRPHDRVGVAEMKQDFQDCLDNKVLIVAFVFSDPLPFVV